MSKMKEFQSFKLSTKTDRGLLKMLHTGATLKVVKQLNREPRLTVIEYNTGYQVGLGASNVRFIGMDAEISYIRTRLESIIDDSIKHYDEAIIGIWLDPISNQVEIEPSINIRDYDEAMQLGKALRQQYVYNWYCDTVEEVK